MFQMKVVHALLFVSMPSLAQTSPVGLWQSIDDATNRPRAEIRISEEAGVLTGRIERNLLTTTSASNLPLLSESILRCSLCPGDRKDKPMIGLDIIRQMRPGSDAQSWEGGEILDPDKGKFYRLRLQLQDGGRKLEVRGYVGPFFRNQTWIRIS